MKINRVKLKNFRIFKNCEIYFSTLEDNNLTVIRAENDTGKTTMMSALQWVLFGDEALPNKGKDYRLHPIDYINPNESIQIEVEIEFEHQVEKRSGSGKTTENYLAVRSVTEKLIGKSDFKRGKSDFKLFNKVSGEGYEPIKGAELYLESMILGSNMMDLFFTDGDRALNFISAEISTTDKRKLVKKAIRDMLGLEILENASINIKKFRKSKRKDAAKHQDDTNFKDIVEYVESLEDDLSMTKKELQEIVDDRMTIKNNLDSIEKSIESILLKGNREDLVEEQKIIESNLKDDRDLLKKEIKYHSDFMESLDVFKYILREKVSGSLSTLNIMWEKGELPKTAVPVLEDFLKSGDCVCGRDLIEGEAPYNQLKELIEEQKTASKVDQRLTELRSILSGMNLDRYSQDYIKERISEITKRISKVEERIEKNEYQKKDLEKRIGDLEQTNIDTLRNQKKILEKSKLDLQKRETTLEANKKEIKDQLRVQKKSLDKHIKSDKKLKALENSLNAVQDLLLLIDETYTDISENEIKVVSKIMNDLFMNMIRSDSDQNVIISRVEITSDYDILAYSKNNKELNPDTDLNGASRRALTLSFILALTKVSEEIAPNIIDTPLGMMDPLVKESVIKTVVENSHQLVLFLTRSEINDVEHLIDANAGKVVTLTNASHYGKKVVNDPGVAYQALKCTCNHRQYCNICERLGDKNSELEYRVN